MPEFPDTPQRRAKLLDRLRRGLIRDEAHYQRILESFPAEKREEVNAHAKQHHKDKIEKLKPGKEKRNA
jgi:hypothetical protein